MCKKSIVTIFFSPLYFCLLHDFFKFKVFADVFGIIIIIYLQNILNYDILIFVIYINFKIVYFENITNDNPKHSVEKFFFISYDIQFFLLILRILYQMLLPSSFEAAMEIVSFLKQFKIA